MATCQCKVCGKEETAQKVTVHNKIRLYPPIGWLEPQLCSTECLQGPNKVKCAYCREPFPTIINDEDRSIQIMNGCLRMIDVAECPEYHEECVLLEGKIHFCPMCGRELKE